MRIQLVFHNLGPTSVDSDKFFFMSFFSKQLSMIAVFMALMLL